MIHGTAIGHLGKDAETKTIPSGKQVTKFSVAANGRGKDAPPTWVECSMWGERGLRVAEFLKKGKKVAAVGTISTRQYDKDGQTRTILELDVQELELLSPKETEPF